MKKWKMAAVIVLCLFVATVSFNRNEVSVYAYTQEEIDAAKAWLEANGYSPTRAGAEQAYQDYLNGKFGPVGGTEETQTPAATEALPAETSVETLPEENVEVVIETGAVVEPLPVETVSEEATTEQEEMMMETSAEEESTSEVLEEVSSADIADETGAEIESSSETEESAEGFIRVGRYDGVIVVIAIAACTAMGYSTYRYVRKEKKDGE